MKAKLTKNASDSSQSDQRPSGDGTWNDQERTVLTTLAAAGTTKRRLHLAHAGSLTETEYNDLKKALKDPTKQESRDKIADRVKTLSGAPDATTLSVADSIKNGRETGWTFELVDDKQKGTSVRRYFEMWYDPAI